MEARKRSPEGRGTLAYPKFLSKCVRNGLPEGGNSKKSSSMLQGKADPVVGAGRVLENSMSGSRQDTSGAAEGPLAEPDCGPRVVSGMDGTAVGKRGPPSLLTPKSAGSGIMRGRALRTEDLNMDGFSRSLAKSRRMGSGARTGVQSPVMSFRSLLEGAINASGIHPSTPVQGIAEPGLQHYGLATTRATPQPFFEGKVLPIEGIPEPRKGYRNFSRRAHDSSSLSGDTVADSGPQVSYSSLLHAQLGDNPGELRTGPSDWNRATTLRLNEEAHSAPVKLQSQSAAVEGGFLALLNQTTRLLAPVAQRPSSPRADFMSIGGRASNVAVAGDASRSAEIASERDGRDSLRTTAVLASAMPARSEADVQRTEAVVQRSSLAADSRNSVEDALGTSLLKEGGSPSIVNESRSAGILSERVGIDFLETAAVPRSADLSGIEEDASPADVAEVRASFMVADSAAIDSEMTDAELFEELLRGLAIEESRFAVNTTNMGAIESREAAVVSASLASTAKEQGLSREEAVMEQSPVAVSIDEKALDVQALEEVLQEHALNESRFAGIVLERDAINLSGAAAVPASPVLVIREEDIPRVEVEVAGSAENDEKKPDANVSDESSKALALDGLRNPDIVIEGDAAFLPESAAVAASPMPISIREDISLSDSSKEEGGPYGSSVVHSDQGNGHLLSLDRFDGQGLDERTQSFSQRLELENCCADGRDDLPGAGTTLDSSRQEGLKQMGDVNADSMNPETILECSCKADLKEMEDVDTDFLGLRKDDWCGITGAAPSIEYPCPAVPEQTEKRNASFEEEQNNESCDAHMVSSTDNLQMKSKADSDSTKAVLEKELETSNNGPVYSVPLDAGSFVGSSWQAVPKHSEDRKGMVGREEEDYTCHIPVLESLLRQRGGAAEVHLMGGDDASGPQRSCVASFDITSSNASPLIKGSLLIAECTRTDGGDHAGSWVEEKVEQERILGAVEASYEVIKRPEVEQHNFDTLADELPDKKMAILPCSGTPAVDEGFVISKTSFESEELPPSKLNVEPGNQNEEERVLEGHVGEIVDVATDSDNSGVPADQALSASPGAIFEGLRQVSVRDSDATLSESLESAQVSGAEFAAGHQEAGKEVQSPLVMKSKDRHSQDAGDLEQRHVTRHEDLENEEQPYASPLNGTVNNQLVGAGIEVRPFKKRGRPRAYNHEKSFHGTGRPQMQPSGSKRKRQLQYAGNRWRRNRHIDPDQPVPVYIEGRDEGFEEADGDAFTRWLGHHDQGNSAPSSTVRKSARNHVQELVKPVIAIPSFRLVPNYDDWQQEVDKRRKVDMQQHFVPISDETLMSSRTVRASDYDMDDEDERWLHAWNKRLARGGWKEPISEDKFEEIIEYFERMYAQIEAAAAGDLAGFPDLPKSSAPSEPGSSLPSTSPSGLGCLSINPAATSDTVTEKPSEDSLQKSFKHPAAEHQPSDDCCICNGGEDDETNPVYTCKQCLIHVHQSCYGIREKFRDDEGRVIAPPSWCCRKCEAVAVGTALPNVSCVLCRKRGGALKPTVSPRKWAHVACALYTNETFFVDPDAMEPIDGISVVAARAQDRQDRCGICGVKRGICSLCSVKYCRAPFHISCGVSQGASFELQQSRQKVVGVRSYCPRHAGTSPMNSARSPRMKQGHLVGSSTTSGATASATASGSISTASSMDNREERYSRLNTTSLGMDGIFADPDTQGTSVGRGDADLVDNRVSVTGKGIDDAGRGRSNGLRFTLKRKWDDSFTQVSEDGFSSDTHNKSINGRGVTEDKLEAPGCKSIWHVVEPGQKLKKIKFKLGKVTQNQGPKSSLTLFQQDRMGNGNPEAENIEGMPVGEAADDAGAVNDRDAVFVNNLSEGRFAKEVKELTILGEAMKSSLAPTHVMREAFVYWRAKRAAIKGSLLCELHHSEWSKSQSIFNKDPSDEGNLATGKPRVPLSGQPSPVSIEKMLEKAKELREQLHLVRSMAQMVVQREKIKCNQTQLALMIASGELNGAESTLEERHCVWCPSTKTLLKCGTCLRSFCFNCFKNRKGFGVKGWMAAAKQTVYSCKYCRELLSNVTNLSSNLATLREEIVDAGLVSTPVIPREPVEEIVRTPVIPREPEEMVRMPVIPCEPPPLGGRGKGPGKGRDEGWGFQGLDNPGPASLPLVGGGVTAPAKGLGIGRGKGNGWTGSDNAGSGSSSRPGSARRGSENGANNQSKPSESEAGLNNFMGITNDQVEHPSFETPLRRLKILMRRNKDASREVTMTTATGIPAGDTAAEETTAGVRASLPASDALETERQSTANGDHLSPPTSGPALLVYKKTRKILSASSESPSAYDFSDELNRNHPVSSPAGREDGATETTASPRSGVITKRLEIGGLKRIED